MIKKDQVQQKTSLGYQRFKEGKKNLRRNKKRKKDNKS